MGRVYKEIKKSPLDEKKRRRENIWYNRWHTLSKLLKTSDKETVLRAIFKLVDNCNGHNYAWIAWSSYEDLNLVIEDCLKANCDECEHRFMCFTERVK